MHLVPDATLLALVGSDSPSPVSANRGAEVRRGYDSGADPEERPRNRSLAPPPLLPARPPGLALHAPPLLRALLLHGTHAHHEDGDESDVSTVHERMYPRTHTFVCTYTWLYQTRDLSVCFGLSQIAVHLSCRPGTVPVLRKWHCIACCMHPRPQYGARSLAPKNHPFFFLITFYGTLCLFRAHPPHVSRM